MEAIALIGDADALGAFGAVIEAVVSAEECAGERTVDGQEITITDIAFVPDRIDELAGLQSEWVVLAKAIGCIGILEGFAPAAGRDIDHEEILKQRADDVALESEHEIMNFEAIMFAAAGLGDGRTTAGIEAAVEGLNGLAVVEDAAELGQYPGMQEEISVIAGDIQSGVGVVSGHACSDGHKLALVVGVGLDFLHGRCVVGVGVRLLGFKSLDFGFKLIDLLLHLLVGGG